MRLPFGGTGDAYCWEDEGVHEHGIHLAFAGRNGWMPFMQSHHVVQVVSLPLALQVFGVAGFLAVVVLEAAVPQGHWP